MASGRMVFRKEIIPLIFPLFFVILLGTAQASDILLSENQVQSNGYYKVYLPDKIGVAYIQGNYRNGKREGRFETYHEKTQLRLEICHYYAGEKHGICKKYHPKTGEILKVAEFYAGVPHGSYKEYYANGKMKREISFIYGRKKGTEKNYHPNGKLASRVEWDNDVEKSRREFTSSGKLIKR